MTMSSQNPPAAEAFLRNLLEVMKEEGSDAVPMLLAAQRYVADLEGMRDSIQTAQKDLLEQLGKIEDAHQTMLEAAGKGVSIDQETANTFYDAKTQVKQLLTAILDPVKPGVTPAPSPGSPTAHRDHGKAVKQAGSKVG